MKEYDNLLDRLQVLYEKDYAEKSFKILGVIVELMNELDYNHLEGARMMREFKLDRLDIRVTFNPKYKNHD